MEHHARLTTKYAAPTLCIDRILEAASSKMGFERPHWPGPKPKEI